jgi:hypothetical protein
MAGTSPDDRAQAHYKWAVRYAGKGNVNRAIPHFGLALYYSRSARSEFGVRNAKRRRDDGDGDDLRLQLSELAVRRPGSESFALDSMSDQLPTLDNTKRRTIQVDAASTWSDVDVLCREGDQPYTVMHNGAEARVNILGKILSLFQGVFASVLSSTHTSTVRTNKYDDETLDSIADRIAKLLMYDSGNRTITIDENSTTPVNLHVLLKRRYETIRVCKTSIFMDTIELCSPARRFTTQLVQRLDLIGAEDAPYSLYFCSQGLVYWSHGVV